MLAGLLLGSIVSRRDAARPELSNRLAYGLPELAGALGLGESTVRRLVASGQIATTRIGGRRLVPVGEVERLLSPDVVAALEELVDARVDRRLAEHEHANGIQPSPFLSIVEAAEYLRCKRARIDDLLSGGRIPRVKEGSRTLLRRSDLDAYLKTAENRRERP